MIQTTQDIVQSISKLFPVTYPLQWVLLQTAEALGL